MLRPIGQRTPGIHALIHIQRAKRHPAEPGKLPFRVAPCLLFEPIHGAFQIDFPAKIRGQLLIPDGLHGCSRVRRCQRTFRFLQQSLFQHPVHTAADPVIQICRS